MTVKEHVHRLVDDLPEDELHAARRFLEYLRALNRDRMLQALEAAPEDDEPTTPEEDAGAAEARGEYRRGEYIPAAQAKREFLA